MTERTYSEEDLKLFEEIANGKTFDKGDELPPLYEKQLKNLLWMQGDSEYAGALGYAPWSWKAPTMHEKFLVSQIFKDEMRHADVIYKLLRDLGEDIETHVANGEFDYRVEDDLSNIGFKRMKDDYRVNIFYYPITYWEDFNLFNFLMDRAAGHQLSDTLESSYLPWKKCIGAIYKEEAMHLAHGDVWIKKLSADPEKKPFLQERLNLWWPRVMNVFGNSKGQRNDVYIKLGLKKRTNGEVRKVFVDEIQAICDECGLTLPEYREEDQPVQ